MKNDFAIPQDTLRYLEILGKDFAKTYIRTIANPKSQFDGAKKGILNSQTLQEWSALRGGMYIVVNDGGDSDESINACRALFIEHDDLSLELQSTCWEGILPQPTMQVFTGGKSLHQYWVFDEPVTVKQWRLLTQKAITALNSDPSVKNPSRLMRLPGFKYFNQKGDSGDVASIRFTSGIKYSFAQLDACLPHIPVPEYTRDALSSKRSSNEEWLASNPCPICGRNIDEKCRMHQDQSFIQCHIGDTYMPPSGKTGDVIKGSDGQLWLQRNKTSNVYGDAVGYSLAQRKSISQKIQNKTELINFVQQEYASSLSFNDLKRRLEIDGKPLKDLNLMHCQLAAEYGIQQTASTVSDSFLFVGKKSIYNPIHRLLLEAEKHKPTCDLDNIGSNYLKLARPIESRVFGIHLLAAVYRAFHPGYQYDQILIMRGKQGVGKTRTIKALAGSPEHYISTSVLTNEKDFLMQLGSCWHCEFEEIDGHIDSRHEAQLKALISRHTDNYRAPYAASVEDQPRRCVFWGTTNQQKLLVDSTGSRRMMIIDLIHDIDHDLLHKDLLPIWSAVMAAYRAGKTPHMTQEEINLVAQISKESFKEDPWLGIIDASIDGAPVVFEHDVLKSILRMEVRNIKGGRSGDQRRVSDCLTQLGYQKYSKQINGLSKHNKGYAARTRGAWFAPCVAQTSNGQMIVELLKSAGKELPVGPGYSNDHNSFLNGKAIHF